MNKQFINELNKIKDLVQEIEDITALQNELINSIHEHNKEKIDELLKTAFVLGEDIDDAIYDVARNHSQKLRMINSIVDKYVDKMNSVEGQLADGVNVLYEMERAVQEAKKLNYLPERV